MLGYRILEEGTLVECHLTWIKEFLPKLDEVVDQTGKCDTLEEYLTLIIRENCLDKQTMEDNDGSGYGEDGSKILVGFMGAKLTEVAFLTYIRDLTGAKEVLSKLCRMVYEFPADLEVEGLNKGHMEAFCYCGKAAVYQIQVFDIDQQRQNKLKPTGREDEQLRKELVSVWNSHSNDKQFMAAINFFKGFLAGGLRLEAEALNKAIAAIKLDPGCFLWCHDGLNRLKKNRKKNRPLFGTPLGPSDGDPREMKYFKMVQKLAPNVPVVMLDKAVTLKEDLWYRPDAYWTPDKINAIIQAFLNLLKIEKNEELIIWNKEKIILKGKVFLAEFLLFGRGRSDALDRERGKNLLEECGQKYPNSSHVVHQLAKMYQGVHPVKRFKDHGKAQEYFLKALEICPANISVLMSFLTFLRKTKDYPLMMEIIDKFLDNSMRQKSIVRVMIERAYVIWIFNPWEDDTHRFDACNTWIRIFTKFPDNRKDVYNSVNKPPPWVQNQCSGANGEQQLKTAVIDELRGMISFARDSKDMEIIQMFIEGLEQPDQPKHKPSSSNRGGYCSRQRGRGRGCNSRMSSAPRQWKSKQSDTSRQLTDRMGNLRISHPPRPQQGTEATATMSASSGAEPGKYIHSHVRRRSKAKPIRK